MAAPKGHKKYGGGRAKGTPNKSTASVKEALTLAFEGLGGVPALLEWAERDNKNQTVFYTIWSKMLPTQITGTDGAPIALCVVEQVVDANQSDPAALGPAIVPQVPDDVPGLLRGPGGGEDVGGSL